MDAGSAPQTRRQTLLSTTSLTPTAPVAAADIARLTQAKAAPGDAIVVREPRRPRIPVHTIKYYGRHVSYNVLSRPGAAGAVGSALSSAGRAFDFISNLSPHVISLGLYTGAALALSATAGYAYYATHKLFAGADRFIHNARSHVAHANQLMRAATCSMVLFGCLEATFSGAQATTNAGIAAMFGLVAWVTMTRAK